MNEQLAIWIVKGLVYLMAIIILSIIHAIIDGILGTKPAGVSHTRNIISTIAGYAIGIAYLLLVLWIYGYEIVKMP